VCAEIIVILIKKRKDDMLIVYFYKISNLILNTPFIIYGIMIIVKI